MPRYLLATCFLVVLTVCTPTAWVVVGVDTVRGSAAPVALRTRPPLDSALVDITLPPPTAARRATVVTQPGP